MFFSSWLFSIHSIKEGNNNAGGKPGQPESCDLMPEKLGFGR
jgi:hypothetical protein